MIIPAAENWENICEIWKMSFRMKHVSNTQDSLLDTFFLTVLTQSIPDSICNKISFLDKKSELHENIIIAKQ